MKSIKALKRILLIFLLCILGISLHAQTLSLELAFNKDTVSIGDTIMLSGKITNVSETVIGSNDTILVNYFVGIETDDIVVQFQDTISPELFGELQFGDTLQYNYELEVTNIYFSAGAQNVVVIWPTTGLAAPPNGEVRDTVWVSGSSSALNLDLVAFSGTYDDTGVRLNWALANEDEDIDYFQIERSIDGSTFTPSGKIERENSNNGLYEFEDWEPHLLRTYYRLRAFGLSGGSELSWTLLVERPEKEMFSIDNLYVSKSEQLLYLTFSSADDVPVSLIIFDINGAIVYEEMLSDIEVGFNQRIIDVHDLYQGVYVLSLRGRKIDFLSRKFIKY